MKKFLKGTKLSLVKGFFLSAAARCLLLTEAVTSVRFPVASLSTVSSWPIVPDRHRDCLPIAIGRHAAFVLFAFCFFLSACTRTEEKLPILGARDVVGTDTTYHTIAPFRFVDQD